MLCTSTTKKQGAEKAGRGYAPSPAETRAIYTFIYWGGGERDGGEPAGWPSFAEIKSLSQTQQKSCLDACVCAGEPQELGAARGKRRREVRADPAPRPRTSPAAQRLPLAAIQGSQPILLGVGFLLSWTRETQKQRVTLDGPTPQLTQ